MAKLQGMGDVAGRVRAGWPGGAWEWDDRLGCALSTVGKEGAEQARALLLTALPGVAGPAELAAAPPAVAQVCGRTGGLMAGQLVFHGELPGGALAYCLWWPWGNGGNVSARIGVTSKELTAAVRTAFGL